MNRLPLDYRSIFSSWRDLSVRLNCPDSAYTARATAAGRGEKLNLLKKIITGHPDVQSCARCGRCCLDFPFACREVEFLHLLPFMAREWTPDRQEEFFNNRLGALGPDGRNLCPFLGPGSCSIYPARPLICRRSICGDHICSRLAAHFDGYGHWCGSGAVATQLTVMNLVYFDYSVDPPGEMGWPVRFDTGPAAGIRKILVAPFEVWLLLLLGHRCFVEGLLNTDGYRPLLRFTDEVGRSRFRLA